MCSSDLDNPTVIARSLNLEAALKDNKLYRETHDNATAMLKHSEAALNQILEANTGFSRCGGMCPSGIPGTCQRLLRLY